jgi:hypothetical protein
MSLVTSKSDDSGNMFLRDFATRLGNLCQLYTYHATQVIRRSYGRQPCSCPAASQHGLDCRFRAAKDDTSQARQGFSKRTPGAELTLDS